MAKKNENSALAEQMLQLYGPLMSGPALYKSLGFGSYLAFHRALTGGNLGVNVFPIKGRRGRFALTTDVAAWLAQQRQPASN